MSDINIKEIELGISALVANIVEGDCDICPCSSLVGNKLICHYRTIGEKCSQTIQKYVEQELSNAHPFADKIAPAESDEWTHEDDGRLLYGYQNQRNSVVRLAMKLNRPIDETFSRLRYLLGTAPNRITVNDYEVDIVRLSADKFILQDDVKKARAALLDMIEERKKRERILCSFYSIIKKLLDVEMSDPAIISLCEELKKPIADFEDF